MILFQGQVEQFLFGSGWPFAFAVTLSFLSSESQLAWPAIVRVGAEHNIIGILYSSVGEGGSIGFFCVLLRCCRCLARLDDRMTLCLNVGL